ncbi:MAG: hypothetical protein GX620_01225 [Chloroflexi bacterium]|nr:hypothetical protein [Chloroflexota bacterium]
MEYKPDFEEATRRIQAFWAHDCIDRCALQVVAHVDPLRFVPDEAAHNAPGDALARKTDVEYVLRQAETHFGTHRFMAEAVPVYTPGLVCSDTAAYLSDEITVTDDTVWYPRIIEDWATFEMRFDPGNRWWQLTKRMASAAAERGAGRYLVGVPDFQAGIDIVSLLRSPESVCLDLRENPDAIKRATAFVLRDVYARCYDDIRGIVRQHGEWVGDWMGLFSTGNHDIVQCDFIALISPRHFEEFCLPDIEWMCQRLDTAIFHLDGPDAVRHLDALLEIDELDAIQWVPGAGSPSAAAWLPMLRKVQAAGKSLYISAPSDDVDDIMQALRPEGLMISVEGVFSSMEAAQSFIGGVERMCVRL